MARDRDNLKEWKIKTATKKKMIAMETLGGECISCGKEPTEDTTVCFDFHHIKQEDRDCTVTSLLVGGYSLDRVLEEADKCVLLCACCHRLYHKKHGYNNFKEQI